MGDLISRAAAIDGIMQMVYEHAGYSASGLLHYTEVRAMLECLPAVDATPVVHGQWINYPECLGYYGACSDEHIVCPNCHAVWNIIDNDADCFDYCPSCGCKMDGEENEKQANA